MFVRDGLATSTNSAGQRGPGAGCPLCAVGLRQDFKPRKPDERFATGRTAHLRLRLQPAGRSGRPKILHRWSSSSCTQRTLAGLPFGNT
jgi:hypothetical protein